MTSISGSDLAIFADGSFDPKSRQGGWAFVVHRGGAEIASGSGRADNSADSAMELTAVVNALHWLENNAAGHAAIIWSDSVPVVNGCNSGRHIWKTNGWKKPNPNGRARKRAIANAELWRTIDLLLDSQPDVSVAWCKGHSGISGNEAADRLADATQR